MKFLSIYFCIFLFQISGLFGQSGWKDFDWDAYEASYKKKLREENNFEELLNFFEKDTARFFQPDTIFNQYIGLGLYHKTLCFECMSIHVGLGKIIYVFVEQDSIRKLVLEENERKKNIIEVFSNDTLFWKRYLEQYNTFYKTNYSLKYFFKKIFEPLGYSLAEDDLGGKLSKRFYKVLKNKNRKKFNHWLRSPNADLQMYGAMGLKVLERKKNISLNEDEKRIMDHLQKENKRINHSGRWILNKSNFLELQEIQEITFNQILEEELDLYFPER